MHVSMLACGQRCLLLPAGQQHNVSRRHIVPRHRGSQELLISSYGVSDSASATTKSAVSQHVNRTAPTAAPAHVDLTAVAADALLNGNGLAKSILADPDIEGDQLAFLKATEAYWKEMRNRKHEPHNKGPAVITNSEESYANLLGSSSRVKRRPSFGAAPAATAPATLSTAAASQAAAEIPHGSSAGSRHHDFDVIMCGGTLGIVLALALQQQGYSVAVVERRRVEGRTQEWNASRHECQVLLDLGLISPAELEEAIVSEFNPIRVGFKGGDPLWVNDCLNVGIHPKTLLHSLRVSFEALGGVVFEQTEFKSAVTCPDGMVVSLAAAANAPVGVGDTNRPNALAKQQQQGTGQLQLQLQWQPQLQHTHGLLHSSSSSSRNGNSNAGGSKAGTAAAAAASGRHPPFKLSCRLLLDCMGHYSPIVKQMRGRAKPDGMVLVVGGCATGFPAELNTTADLLTTITDASADMQLFWEAFPAEGGRARTTYMFAYSDAAPSRPTFEKLLDAYFTLMPAYQGLQEGLQGIKFKRVLFGGFPCYQDAPLRPGFDRVLQLGDASAAQSPLSFGGFGSMLRHLSRLSKSIGHALRDDKLSQADLAWIHPYQPSLSAALLFQRSMSIGVGQLQPQPLQQQQEQQPLRQQEHGTGNVMLVAGVAAAAAAADDDGCSNGSGSHKSNNIVALVGSGMPWYAVSSGSHNESSRGDNHVVLMNGVPQDDSTGSNGLSDVGSGDSSSNAVKVNNFHATNGYSNRNSNGSSNSKTCAQQVIFGSTCASDGESSSSNNSGTAQPSWLKKLLLLPADHINALLGANFSVMLLLGQRVLKPFLQDTLQLGPLALAMLGMMLAKPLVISRVLHQVGAKVLLSWFAHFAMLAVYSVGHILLSPLRCLSSNYAFHRLLDTLQYGSGNDYKYAKSAAVTKAESCRLNEMWAAATAAAGPALAPPPVRAAPAPRMERVRVLQEQHKRDMGQSAGRWQSSELVSHHGQQLRYVVAGGNATQSQEEEALGLASAPGS